MAEAEAVTGVEAQAEAGVEAEAEAKVRAVVEAESEAQEETGPDFEKSWFKKNETIEMYYPYKFIPIYPWKPPQMPPTFPWREDDFPTDKFPREMRYEVKQNITSQSLLYSENGHSKISVPITHLCHCTHTKAADEISKEDNNYCFKSKRKMGRRGTFRYCSEANVKALNSRDTVFPGKLSWWGISTKEWYSSDAGQKTAKSEQDLRRPLQEKIYLSSYLQSKQPPSSHYGNKSFTFEMNKLIDSYKQARYEADDVDIYFRKAGTLRYRHEVCYVILICTGEDVKHKKIKKMPAANAAASEINEKKVFDDRGYLDGEGKVCRKVAEGDIVPHFVSEYPVKAVFSDPKHINYGEYEYERKSYYSWDHLSFAFYFPDDFERDALILSKQDNDEAEGSPRHSSGYCHMGERRCPHKN